MVPHGRKLLRHGVAVLWALSAVAPVRADQLPGLTQLSGKVSAPESVGQLTIYALNTDRNVGYQVYVVDEEYRVTNMFPGNYEVTLRGTVGQMSWGLSQQTVKSEITANETGTVDFTLRDTTVLPVYVGGITYEGYSDRPRDGVKPTAVPTPYEEVFPPGRGRELIENICFSCHTVSHLPYNAVRSHWGGRPKRDKATFGITVDRMLARKHYMDGRKLVLSKEDRTALIEYLDENFGVDSVPRAVLQERDPALDKNALAKAQVIEYIQPRTEEFPARSSHHVTFNPDGTIWTLDRGTRKEAGSSPGPIWIDPTTGESRFYPIGDQRGEPTVVEWIWADVDGSVWFAGLRHFDPKTGKTDIYMEKGPNGPRHMAVSTGIFDSNGDMWMTGFNEGIRKWDRSRDEILRWEVPLYRAAPYGLTLDSKDRVWVAESGTDGVGLFDPETEEFRHYQLVTNHPIAYQFRRLGVDSKDMIWAAPWASYAAQNSQLYRLDPDTAEVKGWKIPIDYANPYDTAVDQFDAVWVATANHLMKFDQNTEKFTLYPTPSRTDIPRLTITREGAIWFASRNAGETGGYGAVASVLYPDKDNITTLKAFYHPDSYFGRHLTQYDGGIVVKPEGKEKLVNPEPQNPGAYDRMLEGMGLEPVNSAEPNKTGSEGIS